MSNCKFAAEVVKVPSAGVVAKEIWKYRIFCDTHQIVIFKDQASSHHQAASWALDELETFSNCETCTELAIHDDWERV